MAWHGMAQLDTMISKTWREQWTLAGIRASVWAVALAMLLGVFSLYVRPDFMVMLADMVWACF
jgi:hypothetical protein